MKTLILYASKYGAAKEIAQRIAQKMDDAVIYDLKQGNIPPIADFDCIILGSSIYAGSMRKEAKAFVAKNAEALGKKTLGLFLTGLSENSSYFEKNFSQSFLAKAKATKFLEGIFDPQKVNAIERFIMKAVAKQNVYVNRISEDAIDQFVSSIKGHSL